MFKSDAVFFLLFSFVVLVLGTILYYRNYFELLVIIAIVVFFLEQSKSK